jgi:hypothetical protein
MSWHKQSLVGDMSWHNQNPMVPRLELAAGHVCCSMCAGKPPMGLNIPVESHRNLEEKI